MQAVLANLTSQLHWIQGRKIQSIFIGGGTPSLCSIEAMKFLFSGLREKLDFANDIETTLEVNPGAIDKGKFSDLKTIGVNRLSIGVQSFDNKHLKHLGRIHSSQQAITTIQQAQALGFDNINIDLMFGFETQSINECLNDVKQAIALSPAHISFYQLTIEPNTLFAKHPPKISQENAWEMQSQGQLLLEKAGFPQYEVSAFSQQPTKHNLNYWHFGDYLGIGAGAHGKITIDGGIIRTLQSKSPKDFMNNNQNKISKVDNIGFEFMLNALRLKQGFSLNLFEKRTGQSIETIRSQLNKAQALGLLELDNQQFYPSKRGFDLLNDLQEIFLC